MSSVQPGSIETNPTAVLFQVSQEQSHTDKLNRTPSNEELNGIMRRFMERMWDISDNGCPPPAFEYDGDNTWNVSCVGSPNANQNGHFHWVSLALTKWHDFYSVEIKSPASIDVELVNYNFKNEEDFLKIIPLSPKDFFSRWSTPEKEFAKTMPESICPEYGYPGGPCR